MPELTGNGTSFDFFVSYTSRDATFSGFEYGVGSHSGQPS